MSTKATAAHLAVKKGQVTFDAEGNDNQATGYFNRGSW